MTGCFWVVEIWFLDVVGSLKVLGLGLGGCDSWWRFGSVVIVIVVGNHYSYYPFRVHSPSDILHGTPTFKLFPKAY
jgi:hypothetical protein